MKRLVLCFLGHLGVCMVDCFDFAVENGCCDVVVVYGNDCFGVVVVEKVFLVEVDYVANYVVGKEVVGDSSSCCFCRTNFGGCS